MSVCRKLPDGTIQKIAGHTILLDANASEVREGTLGPVNVAAGGTAIVSATFTDPMPDTDYVVILSETTNNHSHNFPTIFEGDKTTTGFRGCVTNVYSAALTLSYHYVAFKPVKIEGYTELQNKVNNPDETPTIDSMNLVTSDGVARAIENASAVWKGTKAEWNALPATDKVKYDLAVLLDQTLVKAIDRTDGTETNVADLSGQFVGTHAEWEAESNKTQYKTAVLTDGRKTVNEVTSTGALNEVADDARIWRGTKEEWEALSAAEKDEWDQAEIETIEAQGLNPFRTLSDPEELSIAANTDYTCPHDGFINISSSTNNGFYAYVNGKPWGASAVAGGNKNSHTVPVQQGDVFKYDGTAQECIVTARWYTTDINPGNPIDYPVVHRSQSLDWDNIIYPTDAEMLAGWTAPADGYFIDHSIPYSDNDQLLVNGILISRSFFGSGVWSTQGVQIPVVKGDVLKHNLSMYPWPNPVMFVPYKDYPDYSTTEHWTGKRWIDGKKIYSRVVQLSSTVNVPTTWGTVPSMPADIDTLVSFSALRKDSGSAGIKQQVDVSRSGSGAFTWMTVTNNMGVNVLIVEYTKTTGD